MCITDAHKYLLEHFREFDFIWASPPCPTHSRVRKSQTAKSKYDDLHSEQNSPVYPSMTLYEEILLLQGYYSGVWVIENVIPWYEPLMDAYKIGRHLFWSNLDLSGISLTASGLHDGSIKDMEQLKGFDLSKYSGVNKKLLLRNCVEHEVAEAIYTRMFKTVEFQKEQIKISRNPRRLF